MIVVDQLVKRLRLRSKVVLIYAVFRELSTLIPFLVFQHFFKEQVQVLLILYTLMIGGFSASGICAFFKNRQVAVGK